MSKGKPPKNDKKRSKVHLLEVIPEHQLLQQDQDQNQNQDSFKHKFAISPDFVVDLTNGQQYVIPFWYWHETKIKKKWEGRRLIDVLLSNESYWNTQFDVDRFKTHCSNQQILINNKPCSHQQILKHGDVINLYTHKHEPPVSYFPPKEILHNNKNTDNNDALNVKRSIGSLSVIYENKDILVVMKPSTISSHPSSLYHKNSIIWMLRNGYYTTTDSIQVENEDEDKDKDKEGESRVSVWYREFNRKSPVNHCSLPSDFNDKIKKKKKKNVNNNNKNEEEENQKFWIIHRLDRLTSGLIIVAKSQQVATYLMGIFRERKVEKEYLALCNGKFNNKAFQTISAPISKSKTSHYRNRMCIDFKAGKSAITHFELIWYNQTKDQSLILCKPETGRTHQIRIHLARIYKTPIVNDVIYNNDVRYDYDKLLRMKINPQLMNDCNLLKKQGEIINGDFNCHICNNGCESVEKWWNGLQSTTVSNHGIYLHALRYKSEVFDIQTELPEWVKPPDENTIIYLNELL